MLNVSISAILPMTGSWQHTVARQQKGAQNVSLAKWMISADLEIQAYGLTGVVPVKYGDYFHRFHTRLWIT